MSIHWWCFLVQLRAWFYIRLCIAHTYTTIRFYIHAMHSSYRKHCTVLTWVVRIWDLLLVVCLLELLPLIGFRQVSSTMQHTSTKVCVWLVLFVLVDDTHIELQLLKMFKGVQRIWHPYIVFRNYFCMASCSWSYIYLYICICQTSISSLNKYYELKKLELLA